MSEVPLCPAAGPSTPTAPLILKLSTLERGVLPFDAKSGGCELDAKSGGC